MAKYPKIGSERAHRVIWELANGPIPDGHVVHHRNGDIMDNQIENLELMTRAEHNRHHHLGRSHSPETRAKMSASHSTPEAFAIKSRTHRGRKQSSQQVARRMESMAEFFASGGSLGKLTPEERSERSSRAAHARWG